MTPRRLLVAFALLLGSSWFVGARLTFVPPPVRAIQAVTADYRTVPVDPVRDVDPWDILRGWGGALPDPSAPAKRITVGDRSWRQPSFQAEQALAFLAVYDRLGDPDYLAGAERLARDLAAHAVRADGALHFPYEFEWYGVEPPWYSGLAQAKALSLFSRLASRSSADEWHDAAGAVFASFLLPARGERWYTFVDERGSLWFEEAPDADQPGRILNGHISAVWSMYDYWMLTDSDQALEMLAGGLATVKDRWSEFRVTADWSRYGLRDGGRSPTYHRAHIRQLRALNVFTLDPEYLAMARQLEEDDRVVRARLRTAAGLGSAAWIVLALLIGRLAMLAASRIRGRPAAGPSVRLQPGPAAEDGGEKRPDSEG
jgi:hypothetical protein